jgi:hypothetical protein
MYNKVIAFFSLLALASGGFVFWGYAKYQNAQDELDKVLEYEKSERDALSSVNDSLREATKISAAPLSFVAAWKDFFSPERTAPAGILDRTIRIAEKEGVGILDKSTIGNRKYGDNEDPVIVCEVTLKCEGEYASLFNFMGELEQAFPTARFDSASFAATETGAATQMDITFFVPMSNLAPQPPPQQAVPGVAQAPLN